MIGQEAVNVAKAFNDALELNGVILTKLDGDARGGAALSIKDVTGVPIKFVGVGEKLDKLEEFRPRADGRPDPRPGRPDGRGREDRQHPAGDVRRRRCRSSRRSWRRATSRSTTSASSSSRSPKMGMKDMIGRMPGMAEMIPEGEDPEVALKRVQGMIDSMTKKEQARPGHDRHRAAAGASPPGPGSSRTRSSSSSSSSTRSGR